MRLSHLALAAFLGFGLSACAGEDEPSEPVQAEEGMGGEAAMPPEGGELESDEPVADAELTSPGDAPVDETAILPDDGDGSAPEPMTSETDEEMSAMFSEPAMPADSSAEALEPEPELASPDTALAADLAPTPSSFTGVVQSAGAAWNPNQPFASGGSHHAGSHHAGSHHGGQVGSYTVRPGDTLARISIKLYGNASRWADIASANELAAPYTLYPGQTLSYPAGGAAHHHQHHASAAPAGGANKSLVVRRGDTLWTLAQKHLGNPYAWQKFVDWNPHLTNPNRIEVGMTLHYKTTSGGAVAHTPAPKAKKPKVAKATPAPAPAPAPKAALAQPAATTPAAAAVPASHSEEPTEDAVENDMPVDEPIVEEEPAAMPVEDVYEEEEVE